MLALAASLIGFVLGCTLGGLAGRSAAPGWTARR
jgi:hypothetical protein